MKTNGGVIFIAVLLSVVGVNAQTPDISRLKTEQITLSGNASKARARPWILVETESKQLKPVGFQPGSRSDSLPSSGVNDAASAALNVGEVQLVPGEKRRYYISYPAISIAGDNRWLKLEVTPDRRGLGYLKDMGAMKWEEVDRMPDLPLKRIVQGVSISINYGVKRVGPEEFVVKALAGHVYALEVQDERTDRRFIFRIDAIETNGDCHVSWKRIPLKK